MTSRFRAAETQTGFSGWIRKNPNLDSIKKGLVAVDSDLWIHRYKHVAGKEYQFMMLVEVKEFGAAMSEYQSDTLHIINQLLRNRRNTRIEWKAVDDRARLAECHSLMSGKRVRVLCFGAHVLKISGDGTFTQWQHIEWNRKPISVEQLESILRFDTDPDTLCPMDHRPGSRHKETTTIVTEKMDLGFDAERQLTKRS